MVPPKYSQVGVLDDGDLVAVGRMMRMEPDYYFIQVAAVSSAHHRKGLGLGLLNALMGEAAQLGAESGYAEVRVEGLVHKLNHQCMGLLFKAGFRNVPEEDEPNNQLLSYQIEIPTPPVTELLTP